MMQTPELPKSFSETPADRGPEAALSPASSEFFHAQLPVLRQTAAPSDPEGVQRRRQAVGECLAAFPQGEDAAALARLLTDEESAQGGQMTRQDLEQFLSVPDQRIATAAGLLYQSVPEASGAAAA